MMSPREGSLDYIARYVRAGVRGFSFNLEVYGAESMLEIMPRKHTRSTPHMSRTVEAAVMLGADGRVRSIVIIGLEEIGPTLEAIEAIASQGADPVLSPFRPAQKTGLEAAEPPTEDYLHRVYSESLEQQSRDTAYDWGRGASLASTTRSSCRTTRATTGIPRTARSASSRADPSRLSTRDRGAAHFRSQVRR